MDSACLSSELPTWSFPADLIASWKHKDNWSCGATKCVVLANKDEWSLRRRRRLLRLKKLLFVTINSNNVEHQLAEKL